tara:strand:+ start:890 stop:1051 length:162 start_codon:yes stop_codon:yes gene_type:complete
MIWKTWYSNGHKLEAKAGEFKTLKEAEEYKIFANNAMGHCSTFTIKKSLGGKL